MALHFSASDQPFSSSTILKLFRKKGKKKEKGSGLSVSSSQHEDDRISSKHVMIENGNISHDKPIKVKDKEQLKNNTTKHSPYDPQSTETRGYNNTLPQKRQQIQGSVDKSFLRFFEESKKMISQDHEAVSTTNYKVKIMLCLSQLLSLNIVFLHLTNIIFSFGKVFKAFFNKLKCNLCL